MATIIIVGYLAGFALIGVYIDRRQKGSGDWATGGGTMGVIMLAAGVAGTRIGGAGTYGVAGDVMNNGVGVLWYGVNSFTALLLVGLFFAVPYRRLALSSVGQVFEKRFGSKRCQALTSLCVQAEYFIVNIIEPFIIGTIISGVTGLPFVYGVYIGGLVILVFTVMGGLRGTAITNVIHCGVIIGGLALVAWVVMQDMGGWSATVMRVNDALAVAGKDEMSWWRYAGIGWASIIALFFSATLHTPAASVYANFSSAAKSESTLLPAFFIAGLLAATMPFLAGLVGLEALAKYGAESGLKGYITITQLATDAGPIIGGIALAAVLAALISSGAPILLGSATMFVNDWVPGSSNFTPATKVRAYKITTVLYGLTATTIAWLVEDSLGSVLKLLLLGFALVVPPAIAITFLFYVKRTSERAAFWGMAVGFFGGLLHWGLNTLFDKTYASSGGFAQAWYELTLYLGEWKDPTFSATLLPIIVILLFILFAPEKTDTQASRRFYRQLAGNASS